MLSRARSPRASSRLKSSLGPSSTGSPPTPEPVNGFGSKLKGRMWRELDYSPATCRFAFVIGDRDDRYVDRLDAQQCIGPCRCRCGTIGTIRDLSIRLFGRRSQAFAGIRGRSEL